MSEQKEEPISATTTTRTEADRQDALLLRAFAESGCQQSFARLLGRRWADAYILARRCLGDPAAAEDVTQRAFIDLARNADRYQPGRSFDSWFQTLLLNRVRNELRSQARRRKREEAAARSERVPPRSSDRLDAETVSAHVEALPDRLRLPIVLHYGEGLTQKRVAAHLDCPPGTVASRLRTGLACLRRSLERAGFPAVVLGTQLEEVLAAPMAKSPPPVPPVETLLKGRHLGAIKTAVAAMLTTLALVVGGMAAADFLERLGAEQSEGTTRAGAVAASDRGRGPSRTTSKEGSAVPSSKVARSSDTRDGAAAKEHEDPGVAAETEKSEATGVTGTLVVQLEDDLGRPLGSGIEVKAFPAILNEDGSVTISLSFDVDGVEREASWATGKSNTEGRVDLEVTAGPGYLLWIQRDFAQWSRARRQWNEGPPESRPDHVLPRQWEFRPPKHSLVTVAPGEHLPVTLAVPRFAEVEVNVSGALPGDWEKVRAAASTAGLHMSSGAAHFSRRTRRGRLTLAAPGEVTVSATCEGYQRDTRTMEIAPGGKVSVDLELTPLRWRLSGTVVDRLTGQTVEEAEIQIGSKEWQQVDPLGFVVQLEDEDEQLAVRVPGYVRTQVDIPEFDSHDSHHQMHLTVQRAASVVILLEGMPAGSQHVYLATTRDLPDLEHVRPYDETPEFELGKQRPFSWSSVGTTTDQWIAIGETSSGRIPLGGLPPGQYRVSTVGLFRKNGWKPVTLRAGETATVTLSGDEK